MNEETEEINKILDGLSDDEQRELLLLHFDKRATEQWLIEYYNKEPLENLKVDLSRCKK